MIIKSFSELIDKAKRKKTVTMAIAAAEDTHLIEAVAHATAEDIIKPIFVGNAKKIKEICKSIDFNISGFKIINEVNPAIAAEKAVKEIREGRAEILMKGLVSTAPLLKAVLNKEAGLRKGETLSHIAIFESRYYHKILCVTDAGINIEPNLEEKVEIIKNAVEAFHKLGVRKPKVAVIGAIEKVNPKMEPTLHAASLTSMYERKQIKGCIIDGPLALDNAVSVESAKHKGIKTEVGGDADILLTPDIYSGNILYKALNFLGGATSAAVVMGATVPIVLTSRADSEDSKYMSIVLAAAMDQI